MGGPGRGPWLTAIKPKSRRSTAFVVDAFNNVLGFFAARPGSAFLLSATFMSGDDLRKIHVVPREKFAVLTYGMRNGDPRGTSIYRPAYNAWQIKKEIIPEYYAYLQRFAGGFIWGTTAEGAKEMARRDPSTNEVLRDAAGNPITLTPQEQMNAVLLDIKNGAVGSFPFGAALHELTVPGEGGAFTSAFDVLNREMVTAVLNSPRAMLEAKNNSKADNSVGQDLLGMAVARLKRWAEAMLDKDVLWKIAYYKFGREVADQFAPRASLSDTAREDRAGMIKAYAAAGWRLTKNQWPGVSEELNLTEPDLESGYLYGSTDANVAAATDAAQSSPDDADEEEDETSEP